MPMVGWVGCGGGGVCDCTKVGISIVLVYGGGGGWAYLRQGERRYSVYSYRNNRRSRDYIWLDVRGGVSNWMMEIDFLIKISTDISIYRHAHIYIYIYHM